MRARNQPALVLVIVLLPVLVTLLLVHGLLGSKLSDHHPVLSDEVAYWRQIATFSRAGFYGGYITFNEFPAPASFSHFYSHGPAFPALYGSFAHFTGWYPQSAPFFNIAIVTLALAMFVYLIVRTCPGSHKALLATALAVLTFWPLWLYLPATMQESLHHAIAFGMAYLFVMWSGDVKPPRPTQPRNAGLFIICAISIAALFRFTWALLLIPFFLLAADSDARLRFLLPKWWMRLSIALMLCAALYALLQWLTAPYPHFFRDAIDALSESPAAALSVVFEHWGENLQNFFRGDLLWLAQRGQIVFLIAAALTLLSGRGQRILGNMPRAEAIFHALNLGLALLFNALLYDIGSLRDYRLLAPHVLVSLLVLIACQRWRLVGLMIVSNALLIGAFVTDFVDDRAEAYEPAPEVMAYETLFDTYMPFDYDTDNAWCNTLSTDNFYPELVAVPPEFGTSFVFLREGRSHLLQPQFPLKARYLLLTDDLYFRLGQLSPGGGLNVRPLVVTSIGDLYLNLNADCDPTPTLASP